jgi:4-amino-4-deoxy-L-arabinose transferase-like glycosyltransferase
MDNAGSKGSSGRRITYVIAAVAVAEVLVHLFSNVFAHYGYFRDELYYIACSRHLAAGYVDQPPLSSFILYISIKLFGDSIFALRLLPALASGITVYLTGLIARKLNGGTFAVTLACLTMAIAPQFLGTNTVYSMNGFDWLFWSLGAYIVLLIVQSEESIPRTKRLWILLGVVLGLGLLNKIDMLWFGFSFLVGLLLTPQRIHLKTVWPYIAGLIAFIIFSPYTVWNITHNFATLEFIHNASSIKYASQNPLNFISDTIRKFSVEHSHELETVRLSRA